jgi:hypothetical protein
MTSPANGIDRRGPQVTGTVLRQVAPLSAWEEHPGPP